MAALAPTRSGRRRQTTIGESVESLTAKLTAAESQLRHAGLEDCAPTSFIQVGNFDIWHTRTLPYAAGFAKERQCKVILSKLSVEAMEYVTHCFISNADPAFQPTPRRNRSLYIVSLTMLTRRRFSGNSEENLFSIHFRHRLSGNSNAATNNADPEALFSQLRGELILFAFQTSAIRTLQRRDLQC